MQEVRPKHGPAEVPVLLDGSVFRSHEPLQAVAVNEGADGGGCLHGGDTPELAQANSFLDESRVAPPALLEEVRQ